MSVFSRVRVRVTATGRLHAMRGLGLPAALAAAEIAGTT